MVYIPKFMNHEVITYVIGYQNMSQCRMDKSDIRGEYPKFDGYDMDLVFFLSVVYGYGYGYIIFI